MNTDLLAEFEAAGQTLDALGAASREPRASIEERLSQDISDLRLHGLDDSWHTRWIHVPLRAIRLLEGLRLKLMVELDEVRQELREAEAELSLLREAGRVADAEFASRRAVRLLCHEADVREHLDAPVAHRITAARNGIARILEVSLRHAGREAIRAARESAQPGADPSLCQEAFERAEAYNRLVAEAHRVTGGVDVPVFLPDHIARLRAVVAGRLEGRPERASPEASAPPAATASKPARPVVPLSPAGLAPAAPAEPPKTRPSLPRLRNLIIDA